MLNPIIWCHVEGNRPLKNEIWGNFFWESNEAKMIRASKWLLRDLAELWLVTQSNPWQTGLDVWPLDFPLCRYRVQNLVWTGPWSDSEVATAYTGSQRTQVKIQFHHNGSKAGLGNAWREVVGEIPSPWQNWTIIKHLLYARTFT